MGHYEDDIMYIHNIVVEEGLQKKFDIQLQKMSLQKKHKFKSVKEKWDYALYRIKGGKSIEKC
jgi:hypothetical protein|tara:strand:+ start:144 stop:332 length:189 start_codon:yes stop_codon:yes gene_type:complete